MLEAFRVEVTMADASLQTRHMHMHNVDVY